MPDDIQPPSDPPVRSSDIVRQTVTAFRKRATTWERDEGELGGIIASEIRTIIDTFESILSAPNDQAQR